MTAVVEAPVLELRGLGVTFATADGPVVAVDGVDLCVEPGEVVALVGESGCGKTTVALASAGLLTSQARVTGEVTLCGTGLRGLRESELRRLRGRRVGFVFQDPLTSLNPLLTIGAQIAEVARTHLGMGHRQARAHAQALLEQVHIDHAAARLADYPHEFSGGMRQRAVMAAALAGEPQLLVADEPTTALDVTVQAEVLALIRGICRDRGLGVLFITHDLGVASQISDRVVVMYAGEVVEQGETASTFDAPLMPYTAALLASHPSRATAADGQLAAIPGEPPAPGAARVGCRFASRCMHAREVCVEGHPGLVRRDGEGHGARCWATEPGTGWLEWAA